MKDKGFVGSIIKGFILFNGLGILSASIASMVVSLSMYTTSLGVVSIIDLFLASWSTPYDFLTGVLYVHQSAIWIVLLVMASAPPLFFHFVGELYVYLSGSETNPDEISVKLCGVAGILLGVVVGSGVFYLALLIANIFN